VGWGHPGPGLSGQGRRRRHGYGVLAEAVLIDGGRWIWRGALVLFLLVSVWNILERDSDPFASVHVLDWRSPGPWFYGR
jgi:hypothetical protein